MLLKARHGIPFGVFILAMALLSACHSEHVTVNPANPRSPQFEYRHDQLALLTLAADDIMMLEQKKQYNRIFDYYASQQLKQTLGRRRFMKISNCVETHLGGLVEFDKKNVGFNRIEEKGHTYDYVIRQTDRTDVNIDEKLVFVFDGAEYKLYGISWETERKDFLACLKDARKAAPREKEVPPEQTHLPGEKRTKKP